MGTISGYRAYAYFDEMTIKPVNYAITEIMRSGWGR